VSKAFWSSSVRDTIVGRFLPTLISSLSIFSGNKNFMYGVIHSSHNLFKVLEACLQLTKERCGLDDTVATTALSELTKVVVESKHPTTKNTKQDYAISSPGATALILVFDPKCFAIKGTEHVQLFKGKIKVKDLDENKAVSAITISFSNPLLINF
jgi:hypothetical protein